MLALLLAGALSSALPDTTAAPSMRSVRDTVRSGRTDEWNVPVLITNPGTRGLYLDSMIVRVEDAEAAKRGRPPVSVTRPRSVLRAVPAVSAGETTTLSYVAPATIERGRITLTIHAHRGSDEHRVLECSIVVDAGASSGAWPPRTMRVGGRDVEWLRAASRRDSAGAPGLLLVADDRSDARLLLPQVRQLVERGFHVVAMSLPGRGLSAGPDDVAGPASVAAASAALDSLLATPGVDQARVGVMGLGDGADVALLLAARRPTVHAVIASGGAYDPWAAFRAASEARRTRVLAAAGADSAAWRARSPILAAAKLRSRVVLVGAEDDSRARATAAALERAGVVVQRRELPEGSERGAREVLEACENDLLSLFGR